MKKVAVIVDTFPRWSERSIARELNELLRRGVDLTVFCLKEGAAADADDEWRELLPRRRVLPKWFDARVMLEAFIGVTELTDAEHRRRFLAAAFHSHPFDLLRISRAHWLEKLLLREKFEHVHAHFAGLPSSIGWAAAGGASLPLTISVHARDLFVSPQLLETKLRDAVRIFTCHRNAYEFQKKQPHAEKVVLMHHGLPLEQFPFTPRKVTAAAPHLIAAGRFVAKKGFDWLIEAFAKSELSRQAAHLTLIGDGPGRATLQTMIERSGLSAQIQIQPPLSASELKKTLASATAFIAPYREAADGDVDGVPNIILECFALGVPVIGTTAGGLGEVLSEKTGTLIRGETLNIESTPEKLHAARALVEAEYDIGKNIEPLVELLA